MAHRRWLANQKFENMPRSKSSLSGEGIDAIEDAVQRLRRLGETARSQSCRRWSMALVVEAYQVMRGAVSRRCDFAAEIGDVRRFDTPRAADVPSSVLSRRNARPRDTIRRKGLNL